MPTEPVKPEAKSAEGPEAEFSFKLPIKFPHKLVLYLITVLLGGGTLWTSCDQNQVRSDTELVSKATYGTLADKLNQAVTRLAVAGRLSPSTTSAGSMVSVRRANSGIRRRTNPCMTTWPA